MLRRLRDARPEGDRGVSLVELAVAMAVGSVLLLALGTVLAGTLRGSVAATERVTSSAELRTALDTMARRLRLAVLPVGQPAAFTSATSTSVSFYANLVPPGSTGCPAVAPETGTVACPPSRVEYAVAGECLWETRTTPTGTAATGWSWDTTSGAVQSTTCLARQQVDTSAPLFTYYATSDISAVPLTLPVADLAAVQSVAIDLGLRARASSPLSRAGTRLTLVNLLPTP